MAVTFLTGFEAQSAPTDWSVGSLTGTAAYSTAQARTGVASLRCNPASGVTGYAANISGNFLHFALRIASLPSVTRVFAGGSIGNRLRLTPTGTIEYFDGTSVVGTSAALSTNVWYWVGWDTRASITGTLLQIDGATSVTGTSGGTAADNVLGFRLTEASAVDVYFDDVIADSASFLAPSKVDTALPISDNSRGNATGGAGGTTNLWDAVNNTPPAGAATDTDATNIKCPASTVVNYLVNVETYTTLGIVTGDTILAVQSVVRHGEDVATGTKNGTFGAVTNPTITGTAATFGTDTGAHGAEVGNWKTAFGTLTTSPSVTLGTSPTLAVVRASELRVGCVDFMGLAVAWTPASSTPKSGTDAGVGTDGSAVVTQGYASTESGVGADTTSPLAAAITGTAEAGVGADSRQNLGVSTTDAGAGADAGAVVDRLLATTTDAGAGSDTASVQVSASDSAVGSDSGVAQYSVYPNVAATNTSTRGTTGTSHTVSLPASIASGDLLIVFFGTVNTDPGAQTWPSGWNVMAGAYNGSWFLGDYVYYKVADGSEGASITVTTTGAVTSAHSSFRISAGTWTGTPEAGLTSGTSTNADPPNQAPTWGSDANLWIANAAIYITAITGYPSGYTGTGIAHVASWVDEAAAWKQATASSENPGTFTNGSTGWYGITAAVRGVTATIKTGADSGVGSDTGAGVSLATTDAGVGADANAVVDQGTADKTATDAGAGADTSLPVDRLLATTADSGAGTDTGAAITLGTTTDAGVGSDASAAVTVPVLATEAGAGADTSLPVDRLLATTTDAAVGADTSLPVDRLLATTADAGAGSDAGAAISLGTTTEAGAGTDTSAGIALGTTTDAGAGSDTNAAVDRLLATTTDAGAGADAGAVVDRLLTTTTDSGVGSDAASVDTGTTAKSASDSGVGADVLATIGPAVSDTGMGSESISGREIGTSDGSAGSAIIGNAPVLFDAETGDVFISLGGVLIAKTS